MDDPEVTMEYSLITNVSNDLSDVSDGLSNGINNSSKKLENLNDPEASRVFRLVSNISNGLSRISNFTAYFAYLTHFSCDC